MCAGKLNGKCGRVFVSARSPLKTAGRHVSHEARRASPPEICRRELEPWVLGEFTRRRIDAGSRICRRPDGTLGADFHGMLN